MWRHTLQYFLIRAINGVLGLSTIYVLTRLLNAEQYGLYVLGLASINVAASILFQWLNAGIARLSSTYSNAQAVFFDEVQWLFKMTVIMGLIILIIWLFMKPEKSISAELSISVGVGAITMGAYNMHLQIHNSYLQPLHYGIMSTSRAAFLLAIAGTATWLGLGANGALAGVMISCLLSVYFFGHKFISTDKTRQRSLEVRSKIVSYGAPLALTYAATMVIDVSDRFLIGWWYGPASVGSYAASYDLAQQTIGVILSVFYLAAYPRITKAWETGGSTSALKSIEPLARVLLLAAGTIAGIFIGLSGDIAHFMFGPELRKDATLIMPWIVSAIAIGCIKGYLFDIALQLERRTSTQLRITIAMAAINLALNFALLPTFGILGSAVAATSAFAIGAIVSYFVGKKINVIPPIRVDVIKILLSVAIMILFLRWLAGLWPAGDAGLIFIPFKMAGGIAVLVLSAVAMNASGCRDLLTSLLLRKLA
jgi:O-antigen/teichoic acid export membrane protein